MLKPPFNNSEAKDSKGEGRKLQKDLDDLATQKFTFSQFKKKHFPLSLKALSTFSNITTTQYGRTLLHLAVYENELELIHSLKGIPSVKKKKDVFGLRPVDLAYFLDRFEAVQCLDSLKEELVTSLRSVTGYFQHLSVPVFENTRHLDTVLKIVSEAKKRGKIPLEKIWMGIYFDKEIQNQIYPSVQVQKINEEIGSGVFAKERIASCAFVGEYTGVIQKKTPQQLREKKYCLRYTVWGANINFAIDAEEKGNFTRFLNHSGTPNLGIQSVYWRGLPRMIFISLREIVKGEQLTFDYGPIFWKYTPEPPKEL